MGSWLYEDGYQNVKIDVGESQQLGSLRVELTDIQMSRSILLPLLSRSTRTVEILPQLQKDIYVVMGGTTEHRGPPREPILR